MSEREKEILYQIGTINAQVRQLKAERKELVNELVKLRVKEEGDK